MIAPYFLAIMANDRWFDDMVQGAAGLSILIAVFVIVIGVMPAIFLRERFMDLAEVEAQQKFAQPDGMMSIVLRGMVDFFRGFMITIRFKPFLKLCAATFLVFNGFMLIAAFQSYVIIYYVFGGDTDAGAAFVGHSGLLGAVSTLFVIVISTWLGTKIGKRGAFFVTTGISMVGYALKWFCYNPELPWLLLLPAPLMAFGLGGLFTLMPSMIADVVDLDELETGERREGMYGSIFWWVVKLGMAAALAGGGFLLNATGFDVALEGNQPERAIILMRLFDAFIPAIASGIAIWAIATFSVTEEKAHEVRLKLEARRGVV
jgi:GPH family glycoside/pentoside/hexuronide:cation symporter